MRILILTATAPALYAQELDSIHYPEPEGDLQYFVLMSFAFFAFLAWLGYRIWLNYSKMETAKETESPKQSEFDVKLSQEIAENARQIAQLEQSNEFQQTLFNEHKTRTESNINDIFRKIEDMEKGLSTKVDNLSNTIIRSLQEKV